MKMNKMGNLIAVFFCCFLVLGDAGEFGDFMIFVERLKRLMEENMKIFCLYLSYFSANCTGKVSSNFR
jgi:hypothetical protein